MNNTGRRPSPDLARQILKSPEAQRMVSMVTRGFYDRSRIGLWMYEVIGREYDEMAQWAQTLRLEAFPQTCTWSIAIWEWIYDVMTDESQPLSIRRGKIISKMLQVPPISPARIEAALSALTGAPVMITENIAPYTFSVVVDESGGVIYDYKEALNTLRKIKPSHLSFRYESRIIVEYNTDDYSAGVITEYICEFFIGDESPIKTCTDDYSAGAAADYISEYCIGDEKPIQTNINDYSAAAEVGYYAEIFIEENAIPTETGVYYAGAEMAVITEYFMEEHPIVASAESYTGAAINEVFSEYYSETHPIPESATTYQGCAANEFIKEVFKE